ncbi:TlpA family protein disulfide reductase [Natrarchaeobius oligotrophus]|uniref:TlpA family protein disulfide reductase n=1 Tax=Natrarchaeobius chitinivorans TaxID=1679083 RepID=A0A3N6PLC5_NATCH|nr:redoxin family protein [Natrarchaeobius chitinivorans]RQG99725.1 TlpA family protein disulfide reductase [Natrarchaeobius chitinivorans]
MKRRELVAGVASLGVLAGAGGILSRGLPTFEASDDGGSDDDSSSAPAEIRTIDAPGSAAGTITVPTDGVSVVTFFVTGCGQCQAQVSGVGRARSTLVDRYGDAVTALWLTYQTPETMPEDELREWWAELGGNWLVGYDPTPSIAATYGAVGYPVTIVIDEDGEKRWHENGVQAADRIVRAVESVLEEETGGSDESDGSDGIDEADGSDGTNEADGSDENAGTNETVGAV